MAQEVLSLSLVMTRKTKVLASVVSTAGILLLVAVLVPQIMKSRCTTARDACIANLKQIDAAKTKWQLENDQSRTNVGSSITNAVSTTNHEAH